jgi:hypothetical protein
MIDIIRPISAPVSATALSGRKILMARCGGLPFDAFTPRALLVFAAIEIFAQSGCQALFAIRRLSHHHASILNPISLSKKTYGKE